jgi:mannobiose 2-epimerase
MNEQTIKLFRNHVHNELNGDIVPFWLSHLIDQKNGGFVGRMSNDLTVDENAPKGLILNARLLWTFSALARFTQDNRCLEMAHYAYQTLIRDFWDPRYGGAFWSIHEGKPVCTQKKMYGQAFLIYGLAEYFHLTEDPKCLDLAKELFERIETHAWDDIEGGYFEVAEQNWTLSKKQQLSDDDLVAPKSMNTHLHILEAYTNLYAVWKSPWLGKQLGHLLDMFQQHLVDPATSHFRLFFDKDWTSLTHRISFGHDIEGSWLLDRAAEVLNQASWSEKINPLSLRIAQAVYEEGLDRDFGLLYESNGDGHINAEKHFWCQAEAVVGFLNACQLSRQTRFFDAAWKLWQFIENYQIDRTYGEWFWKLDAGGRPDLSLPKISEWKCPYHNSRACIESIQRLNRLLQTPIVKEEIPCR